MATHVFAQQVDPFEAAGAKMEIVFYGSLGRAVALLAVILGCVMAAVKRDWSWIFGAIILSVVVSIVQSFGWASGG